MRAAPVEAGEAGCVPTSPAGSHRELARQFGVFLIVGGLSFGVDYGLFTVLYALGVPHLVASATSFSLSLIINYVLSRRYVFNVSDEVSIAKEFAGYVALNAVALGLNTLVLYLCSDVGSLSPLWGKIVATAVVLVYNFVSRKLLLEGLGPSRNAVEGNR